jgi:hypothetical protein
MPRSVPIAFVDSSVLALTAEREVLRPETQRLQFGEREIELVVYRPAVRRAIDRIRHAEQKHEAELLVAVSNAARSGNLRLVTQVEVINEASALTDVRGSHLYGVEIDWIDAPFEYSRMIGLHPPSPASARQNDEKLSTLAFLHRLQYPRYLELQIACGARQGNKINQNEMIDAFHVWCAESARADYFLTCDFKLIRAVRSHKRYPPLVKLLKPSELLEELSKANESRMEGP